MNSSIRALVFDYDGTLTKERNTIPSELQRTLVESKERGFLVTLNTGVPYPMLTFKVGEQMSANTSYMLESGGRIVHEEKTYYIAPISSDGLQALSAVMRENDLRLAAFTPESGDAFFIYTDEPAYIQQRYQTAKYTFPSDWIFTDKERFIRTLQEAGGARVALEGRDESFVLPTNGDIPGEITRNSVTYEVKAPGVTKGDVLKRWAKEQDLDLSQIAVFGNDMNDLEMFQTEAGMKVRVGSECLSLAQYATHQVKDAEELALFLRGYFLV